MMRAAMPPCRFSEAAFRHCVAPRDDYYAVLLLMPPPHAYAAATRAALRCRHFSAATPAPLIFMISLPTLMMIATPLPWLPLISLRLHTPFSHHAAA